MTLVRFGRSARPFRRMTKAATRLLKSGRCRRLPCLYAIAFFQANLGRVLKAFMRDVGFSTEQIVSSKPIHLPKDFRKQTIVGYQRAFLWSRPSAEISMETSLSRMSNWT